MKYFFFFLHFHIKIQFDIKIKVNVNMMRTTLPFQQNKKPFCKVCFDAGKSENEYTSHYVKDAPGPHGVVVCPTLFNLNCRHCRKSGHTTSHCVELKKKKQEKNEKNGNYEKYEKQEKKKNGNDVVDLAGSFCPQNKDKDEFPALSSLSSSNKVKVEKNVPKISYSSIVVLSTTEEQFEENETKILQKKSGFPPIFRIPNNNKAAVAFVEEKEEEEEEEEIFDNHYHDKYDHDHDDDDDDDDADDDSFLIRHPDNDYC